MTDTAVSAEGRVRSRPMATDLPTSWTAAVRMTTKQEMVLKSAIIAILRHHAPLADDAIHALYQEAGGRRTAQRVRTARHELERETFDGARVVLVDDAGLTNAGGDASRWGIIEDAA